MTILDRWFALRDLLHRCLLDNGVDLPMPWQDHPSSLPLSSSSLGQEDVFFITFSALPRKTGKAALVVTPEAIAQVQEVCPGWELSRWRADQAARAALVLSLPWETEPERAHRLLETTFAHGDVEELVALYQALPLLPYGERHRVRAAEGVRSNMVAVFNAVALHNPYPAQHLDAIAWNQMVVKALFVGSPLVAIQGLEARANPALATMLTDYAHERWAAGRSVAPELWRFVAPFATAAHHQDFERLLRSPHPTDQAAGALACAIAPLPMLQDLLLAYPHCHHWIQSGHVTWANLKPPEGYSPQAA